LRIALSENRLTIFGPILFAAHRAFRKSTDDFRADTLLLRIVLSENRLTIFGPILFCCASCFPKID